MTSPGCERVKARGTSAGRGAWPFGITAYAEREDNDMIFWLPSIKAIVSGDTLSDFGEGLDIQLGGRKHVTRDAVVQRLRPLLELPVQLVLPAHGEPTDRTALEHALSDVDLQAPWAGPVFRNDAWRNTRNPGCRRTPAA
jgi:hypothetical protein